jgi:uncharacterized protein (TIGR03118 family)
MRRRTIGSSLRTALLASAVALSLPYSTGALCQVAQQINLVTDDAAFLALQGFTPANTVDQNLINPWGMSFSAGSPFWISNQGSNTSTLYTGNGTPAPVGTPLIVTIPSPNAPPGGPTGQAFVGTSTFTMDNNGGNAIFAFANLDGTISAWNPAQGTSAVVQFDNPNVAVYTGLAVGTNGSSNFLYAANNAAGTIDVLNQSFDPVSFGPTAFQDTTLAPGLSPFNVVNIGGNLFVTYAAGGADADEQDLGTGAVNVFSTNGTLLGRFATGGNLLSPWGVAQAPAGFAGLGGDILIGNFSDEDGFINIFDPTGNFLGLLTMSGNPFNMPYLWSLDFRPTGPNVDPNSLYFTAGIGDEDHGLFAQLVPVPEPSTWASMLIGFGVIGLGFRRRGKLKTA